MSNNRPIQIVIPSVSLTGSTYYSPGQNRNGYIRSIAINGPAGVPYTITVTKTLGSTIGGSVVLFSFILNAGDVIADSTQRVLATGDSIQAIASVSGVKMVIDGQEKEVNSTTQGSPSNKK